MLCVCAYKNVKYMGMDMLMLVCRVWNEFASMKFGRYQFSYLIMPHTLANKLLDSDFNTHVLHFGQWVSLQVKARPA